MKKYFFKSDGTIKIVNMIILIAVIFFIVIMFVYFKFLKVRYDEPNETYKKEEKTSKINMCNGCDFSFTLESLVFETYNDYKIDNYLEVKNMSINNIKFEYDKGLISIESSGGGLVIKAGNKIGKTKLVAVYENIKKEIAVEVRAGEIKSIELANHPYYILNNKENDLEIITDPIGIDLSEISISVEDESIARVINGKLVGVNEGVTKLKLLYNGEEQIRDLYVSNDFISVDVLNDKRELEPIYNISLDSFKDDVYNVVVTITDNGNIGYEAKDLVITHEDEGVNVYVEYDGKYSLDKLSYKYRITKSGNAGSSTIKFTLGNTTRIIRVGE
ncbi:MAG: hypothetical protein OSJ65_05700 [Bacilli bacterium]|mgnify:CR=1 FL=1|nr:hypothetical protein [Bacilli bacterium]